MMRIGTWNLDHAVPSRRPAMLELLTRNPADVWVLTETHVAVALPGYSAVHSQQRPLDSQKTREGSRWVSIWSNIPSISPVPSTGYDPTRTASARIALASGRTILISGVVLPWLGDPLFAGQAARIEAMTRQIEEWKRLRSAFPSDLFVIGGDLNQDLGSGTFYGSRAEIDMLRHAFEELNLICVTAPDQAPARDLQFPTVDHIAVPFEEAQQTQIVASWPADPQRYSDHPGVVVELSTPISKGQDDERLDLERDPHAVHHSPTIEERTAHILAAANAVELAWPMICSECLSVLGSELHYQAMIYHALRTAGNVPVDRLGMNVKQWMPNVQSELFRSLGLRKKVDYRGGFEPIPDVVIFSPEVGSDWRRRRAQQTLRHMLLAIEVKASERAGARLSRQEVARDIEKLAAHRVEVRSLGSDFWPVMLVVDSAPLESERMRPADIEYLRSLAKSALVEWRYAAPSGCHVDRPDPPGTSLSHS